MQRFRAALMLMMVWLDTFRGGQNMVQATFGRFYVRYPDGKRSQRFYYRTARQYAELYGGRIVHQATGHELRKQYDAPRKFA